MAEPAPVRAALDAALANSEPVDGALMRALAAVEPATLDETLRDFAHDHGAAALPVLAILASDRADRGVRRAAKRALYRLAQRGVTPPPPAARPVVERRVQHATRAWLSGIDGSGSRAAWILFEDGWGGSALCSLIVNDTVGVLDVAGGEITKKRLETELATLRASQKLPWIESDPARAVALVGEALALHRTLGTTPPAAFARWQPLFEAAPALSAGSDVPVGDPALAGRGAELLELPEFAGWFLEPERVQGEALELAELRQSRLVVSDQIKAEREATIVARALERELAPDARRRWARRLREMAHVLAATERAEPAAIAAAAAAALADETRDLARDPFAVALARRALEVADEVAAGRLSAAEATRKPGA